MSDAVITLNVARFREVGDNSRLDEGGSPDHGALLAFQDAMEKDIIAVPPGVELAMDLLADDDGEIDGLRLLLSIGTTWYYAAPIYRTSYQEDLGSPLEFLRHTVDEANRLYTARLCRSSSMRSSRIPARRSSPRSTASSSSPRRRRSPGTATATRQSSWLSCAA